MSTAQVVFALGLVIAIARLTRFLVVDEFPPIRAIRRGFLRGFAADDGSHGIKPDVPRWGRLAGAAYSIAYVWTCPWCMSFWAGLAVWGAADWATTISVPYPWLLIAAGSLAAGWDGAAWARHEQAYERAQQEIDAENDRIVRR